MIPERGPQTVFFNQLRANNCVINTYTFTYTYTYTYVEGSAIVLCYFKALVIPSMCYLKAQVVPSMCYLNAKVVPRIHYLHAHVVYIVLFLLRV